MGLAPTSRRLAAAAFATAALTAVPLAAGVASAAPTVRGQAAVTVEAAQDNTFKPAEVTVPVGGKVTWTINGVHSVTGGEDGTADPDSPIGDSGIKTEGTYEVTFDKAGRFPYYCIPHVSLGMKGVVIVGDGAAPASTPPASATASPGSPAPAPSSTTEPATGGAGVDDAGHVPGIDNNPVLEEIEAEEKANKQDIGGFQALLWGIVAATLALSVAVFASTRTRRGGSR